MNLRVASALDGLTGILVGLTEHRWRVALSDGTTKAVRPENLAAAAPVRVECYWGDSRWSRTQLLAEICRGHWGVADAVAAAAAAAADRHAAVLERCDFAEPSAMTDPALT